MIVVLRGVKICKCEYFLTLLCIDRHKYICYPVKDFWFGVGYFFKMELAGHSPSLSLLKFDLALLE